MGYQALLFCPDEKTARTVTQVLSELEFNVEACIEPFAAVKKLMGQHFDAVVVDCDNEQNATLLFKSARNSSSNQTSLAVAVVEGQAGVAKAFRIGANLVLTKPINIEQAKGTLRVARGLLRKAEPAKPGAPATTAAPTAAAPAKPAPAPLKPISAVKPAAPVAPPPVATKPIETPAPKPAATPAWPAVPAAVAATPSKKEEEDLLEISIEEPKAPVASAPAAPSIAKDIPAPPVAPTPAPSISKQAFGLGLGSAAAAAPAKTPEPAITQKPQEHAAEALFDKPAEVAAASEPTPIVGSAPSFTFGSSSTEPESEGGKKKIFIGIAAVVVLAAAYFGYSQFKGHSTASTTTSVAAPALAPATTSATSPVKPSAQPAPAPSAQESSASGTPSDAQEITLNSAPASAKASKPASTTPKEDVAEAEPAPLVVKGGKVSSKAKAPAAADVAAPSLAGIAPGTTPTPNFVPNTTPAFKPVLQSLNISQGVSQGLLIKKVAPSYPTAAQRMRIEGTVELLATISKDGAITHVKVLSGDAQLTKAATDAVKQWKYKPYLLNGEPVEIQTQITVNFKLPR